MSLTSDEVNILIYRYLEESGFSHTAFSFVAESQITKSPTAKVNLPPGALLSFLQKGLQYTEIEAHLSDDGTAVPFSGEFSLLTPYLPKGGLVHKQNSSKRKLGGGGRKKGGRRDAHSTGGVNPSVSETDVLPLVGHLGEVYHCLWNPHRSVIASGSEDATVRVWALPSLDNNGRCSRHLSGKISAAAISLDHRPRSDEAGAAADGIGAMSKSSVTVIDWSPDGTRLATGCCDGPVRIWNMDSDGSAMTFSRGLARKMGPILALKWSPDGTLLAGGSDHSGGVTVWNPSDGSVVLQLDTHRKMVSDISWTKVQDSLFLATSSSEPVIHVFGMSSPVPIRTLQGHGGEVNSLQWSPTGTRLLSASDDRTARVWQLTGLADNGSSDGSSPRHRTVVVSLEGHRREVYSARWSPRKWPRPLPLGDTDKETGAAGGGTDSAPAEASSADDDFVVATASFDHAIKIWDPATGQCLRTLTRHSSHVYSVAFSPNGRYLASGSYDSEILVWDVFSGAVLLSYLHSAPSAPVSGIFDVRWNHSGNKVAASFADKTICVLDFDGPATTTDADAEAVTKRTKT